MEDMGEGTYLFCGLQAFISACETSEDTLVYDIYKDVRRTRGSMPYFRDASVQCMLVRILYTYSNAHPEVSYNQVLVVFPPCPSCSAKPL